jgi:hypothetical protein
MRRFKIVRVINMDAEYSEVLQRDRQKRIVHCRDNWRSSLCCTQEVMTQGVSMPDAVFGVGNGALVGFIFTE